MTRFAQLSIKDTDAHVTYVPYVADDGRVGLEIIDSTGRTTYMYFNPSTGGDPPANVFIYQGFDNDPNEDEPLCWLNSCCDCV